MPAHDHFTEIKHAGWTDVPSHFLICENDQILPAPLQEQFAALAGSVVRRCDAGHMVQISQPDTLVKFVVEAANAIS